MAMPLKRIYDCQIDENVRFRKGELWDMREQCAAIAEAVKKFDPSLSFKNRNLHFSNVDNYLLQFTSQYLLEVLGLGYPRDGAGKPMSFAEMNVYPHREGYYVFQRFDFGEGNMQMKRDFLKASESTYESTYWPHNINSTNLTISELGLVSFSELAPGLSRLKEASFERLVQKYYELSKKPVRIVK